MSAKLYEHENDRPWCPKGTDAIERWQTRVAFLAADLSIDNVSAPVFVQRRFLYTNLRSNSQPPMHVTAIQTITVELLWFWLKHLQDRRLPQQQN